MISILIFYSVLIGGVIYSYRNAAIIAFCVYQAVYFFNPATRWWGQQVPDLSYSFFIVLVIFSLFLINYKKYKENKILKAPPLRWAIILVALYWVTYFYAVFPEYHAEFATFYLKTIIIMAIVYKMVCSREDINKMLYGFIFGAWYVSFYVFQVGRNSGNRVEGVGLVDSPDANGLAAAIAPTLVLTLYYMWVKKSLFQKALFAIAGIFIANAIILINSRGAFLGVLVGVSFYLFFMLSSSFKKAHQKKVAMLIVVLGLSGGLYLADDDFISRIKGISEQIEAKDERETGATRTLYWVAAWEMAKDYPLGEGYRTFNYYAPLYMPDTNSITKKSRSVHSTWFEVLTEVGYLGLAFFLFMLFSAWRCLSQCRTQLKRQNKIDEYYKVVAIQGGFLTFIITMTFLNRMRAEILYWLIMFAAAVYNIYVVRSASREDNESTNRPKDVT